jgi:zinc D-Ala-D-Ala carboxypeptidase
MTTWLTPHFALEELVATDHRQFDNQPPPAVRAVLGETAARMEERRVLGDRVISISSGYRCPALNAAVGSSPGSAHVTGHAVDFSCLSLGEPLDVARAIEQAGIVCDQLIHEFGRWAHISFDPRLRGQTLTIDSQGVRPGLLPIR